MDTNLFLVLLIGSIDQRLIGGKRTERYSTDQFCLLMEFLKGFRRLITTPHILAEVSNLGGVALTGKNRECFFSLLRAPDLFADNAKDELVIERYVKRQDVEVDHIQHLGLTDAAIIKLCTSGLFGRPPLLSDDFRLVALVSKLKGEAINFNHIWDAARGL